MRIGLDATPLLGMRTGVGRYVQELLVALSQTGNDDVIATAFTLRGHGQLAGEVPATVQTRARPVPARGLRTLWSRTEFPPVSWLAGRTDVFHGTNFVLPPPGRAAGVLTVHDLSYLRFPETVTADSLQYRELVPRSVQRARVVCTPSNTVAQELCAEYNVPADKVVVTPLGVTEEWFTAPVLTDQQRAQLGLPEQFVVFLGSLQPRKDVPTLLSAYAALRAEDPEFPPLVLVGPPGWGPALDTAGLSADAVITLGYLDAALLRSVVATASCMVFPSQYEGFGLPPLEALACGTPVVASDLPVIREVTGDLATLFPAQDPDALASALRKAVEKDAQSQRERRQQWARQWTWARCAEATRDAYQLAKSLA